MRPFLIALALVASTAHAATQQVGEWTVETRKNPAVPGAFKVIAKHKVGDGELIYERSLLGGTSLEVKKDFCSSSGGINGDPASQAERTALLRTQLTEMARSKDNFCKLSRDQQARLPLGAEPAIAAADSAYERDRPVIAVAPRSTIVEGWTVQDRPDTPVDGLVQSHLLTMRKVSGPFSLTYTTEIGLGLESTRFATRSIEGKYRDCDYQTSEAGEFIGTAARAKAARAQIVREMPANLIGCELTPEALTPLLTGFEAAYLALDGWAIERLDERRTLLEAVAQSDDNAGLEKM